MINCIDLDNFALTGNTSRYNEDSFTAQNLLIKSARRTKECVHLLTNINEGIKGLVNVTSTSYNAKLEELAIANKLKIIYDKTQAIRRWYFLINENSKSLIELASDINKVINDMLTTLPEIVALLKNITGVEDLVKELETLIDSCYLDVYDSCSYTTLELAGNTAKNVNSFIDIVNSFENVVNIINASSIEITYDADNEGIITVIREENNEILIL